MIYDISRPLSEALAGWPGDEYYRFYRSASIADGGRNNVGVVHASLHFGTHIDAPFHFREAGATADNLNLDIFCGVAAVVDSLGRSELTVDVFDDIDFTTASRVLIKTGVWTDSAKFPYNFPVLATGVPEYLGAHGVKLIGIDLPSVDKFNDDSLVNHFALDDRRISILESLDLSGIQPGLYELIALPLRIVGGDGSPVRAILRDLPVKELEGSRRLGQ